MTRASFPRTVFGDGWVHGGEFTAQEAWLDLIQLADSEGVLDITSFTTRWAWDLDRVRAFFERLESHGHIRAHDASRWRLVFQVQEQDLKAEYEHIWRIYPRKVAKQKGYHAYAATRKGRSGEHAHDPFPARELYDATQRYAIARKDEDEEFIMHPATFFGVDRRWQEKHKPKTNSKPKREKGWSKPTSRDLTKSSPPTGTATSPGRKKRTPDQGRKPKPTPKNPRKKKPTKDPLGDL